jgi:hypothetical protein
MGLAECGQLLNLPKLTIPAPYSITRMRQYLEADPEGFKTYARVMLKLPFATP